MAVAETGSLTAAGRKLGMSQPTVGRRIRALETHFGTPLLVKKDGSLVPTSFGSSMLDHIHRMQNEAAAIARSSATLENSLAGPVRISATEGLGTLWVPAAIQTFRKSHPDILLDMTIGYVSANLAQREADIALRWTGPGHQNSLIGRKVADVAFGLYASNDYVKRRPEKLISNDDLVDHDCVLMQTDDQSYLWPKKEDHQTYIPHGRMTFRSNSLYAHMNAIKQGYGIGILPLCYMQANPGLVRIIPHHTHHEDLWIVAHEDLTRSTRIRAVFDFLIEAIAKDKEFFYLGEPSVFEYNEGRVYTPSNADNPDREHAPPHRTLSPNPNRETVTP